MDRNLAYKSSNDFYTEHPGGSDDKKAPRFYEAIIALEKSSQKKIAFIVVAHFLHTLPPFLKALSTLGLIAAIIPKQSECVRRVVESIHKIYGDTIRRDITKEVLQTISEETTESLKTLFKTDDGFEDYKYVIIDHGGYFAPQLSVLSEFKNLLGIVEHTWNGEMRYIACKPDHNPFPCPIYSIARTELKALEDPEVAISIVNAIQTKVLSADGGLNQALSRTTIGIVGYGHLGSMIARLLKKHGLEDDAIRIADISPESRNKARRASYSNVFETLDAMAPNVDLLIIAASGHALTQATVSKLKTDACVICVTSGDDLIEPTALNGYTREKDYGHITRYVLKSETEEKILNLAADGKSINFLIGSTAHPILHAIFSGVYMSVIRLIEQDNQTPTIFNVIQAITKTDQTAILSVYKQYYGAIKTDSESTLSIISNLDIQDKTFVGREDFLDSKHGAIIRKLDEQGRCAITQLGIVGLGGIGKSRLAAEYANQYQHRYQMIWWFDATSTTSIELAYQALARELNDYRTQLRFEGKTPEPIQLSVLEESQVCQRVKAILRTTLDWLLVFDNVTNEAELMHYLPEQPPGSTCHILVTSQLIQFQTFPALPLRVLKITESFELLRQIIYGNQPFQNETSLKAAGELCERLGYHALAIKQAGYYIKTRTESQKEPIVSYLQEFNAVFKELRINSLGKDQLVNYHATVATTTRISIRAIKRIEPELYEIVESLFSIASLMAASNIPMLLLKKVMLLMHYFNGNPITIYLIVYKAAVGLVLDNLDKNPLKMFLKIVNKFKTLTDSFHDNPFKVGLRMMKRVIAQQENIDENRFKTALQLIKRYGLLDTSRETLSFHPFVHTMLKIEFKTERLSYIQNLLLILYDQFEYEERTNQEVIKRVRLLIPHLLSIVEFCKQQSKELGAITCLDIGLGDLYLHQGFHEKAIGVLKEALQIKIKTHGRNHFLVSNILRRLGMIYKWEGRYIEAIKAAEEAKRIRIAKHGRNHITVSDALDILGSVYHAQGRYTEAIQAYEESKRIRIAKYGGNDTSVASILENLGKVYLCQGLKAKAIEAYDEAKRIRIGTDGQYNVPIVFILEGLGGVYLEQEEFEKARALFLEGITLSSEIDCKPDFIVSTLSNSYIREGNKALLETPMNVKLAIECYNESDYYYNPEEPSTHQTLASYFWRVKQLKPALEHYQILIRLDPKHALAHHNLACLLHTSALIELDKGDMAQYHRERIAAAAHFEESIRLSPHVGRYTEYGQFLWKNKSHYQLNTIVEQLEHAIKLKQLSHELCYLLLDRPTLDKRLQELLDESKNELTVKAYFLALYLLIQVHCEAGQPREAKRVYEAFDREVKSFEENQLIGRQTTTHAHYHQDPECKSEELSLLKRLLTMSRETIDTSAVVIDIDSTPEAVDLFCNENEGGHTPLLKLTRTAQQIVEFEDAIELETIKKTETLSPRTRPQGHDFFSTPVNTQYCSDSERNKFSRHPVNPDGDCGYTAFGITRENALELLKSNCVSIQNLLQPAVKGELLTESFFSYLQASGSISPEVTHEMILANIPRYASDLAVISSYLDYDIRDKRVDLGWAHPAVLQALAHVQSIQLRLWRLNEADNSLIPHCTAEHDYAVYTPENTTTTVDLLFINNNHFERLELQREAQGISPLLRIVC